MSFENIAVLGLGKVGRLAAKLLHDSGFNVTGYDVKTPREKLPFAVKNTDLTSPRALAAEFARRIAGPFGHIPVRDPSWPL